MNVDEEYEKTRKYWLDFLKNARLIVTGDKNIDNLYKRSILVFKLMSDERTGGLLASAEIDEGFTRCGAMHTAGKGCGIYYRRTGYRRAYRSSGQILPVAVMTQDDDGSWQQRYHMDGNLAHHGDFR